MRAEAEKRIGHLYPKIAVTAEMARERADLRPLVGKELTVIAWIWARTVRSPNPAFSHVEVPLASTFVLSSKKGKEAYVEPVIEGDGYRFEVRVGELPEGVENGTKLGRGAFRCLMSNVPIKYEYIDAEANAGRMGSRLMAIVAEGTRSRAYLDPSDEHISIARSAVPKWRPETPSRGTFASNAQGRIYGFKVFGDYFTPRQLVALTTFSDLIQEAIEKCKRDITQPRATSGALDSEAPTAHAVEAYANGVGTYLAFALDKLSDLANSLCRWEPVAQCPRQLFGRQAIPMIWDFAEANPLGDSSGAWEVLVDGLCRAFTKAFDSVQRSYKGDARQSDAQTQTISTNKVVSTDPPYYDNIAYADLSDFFYVWMRKSLRSVYPSLYATVAVPKDEELVATPYRHGGHGEAEAFFLNGMTEALRRLAEQAHPAFPVTIYYAFKQSETSASTGTTSTGWETFLDAVLKAGFSVVGTWPMRTENSSRMVGQGTNALASSIVLVCRKRPADAPTVNRREFLRQLDAVLTEALDEMTRGGVNSPIAPVDLSQAIIGPGMAVFASTQPCAKPMARRCPYAPHCN
jgi:putative DNA methylase